MSDSFNTETSLRALAEKLRHEASALEEAADVLRILREAHGHQKDIDRAYAAARSWVAK